MDFVAHDEDFLKMHNNIYISDKNLAILKQYNINIDNYNNVSELIYDIESILNYEYSEELDYVSYALAEYNYYTNTNK